MNWSGELSEVLEFCLGVTGGQGSRPGVVYCPVGVTLGVVSCGNVKSDAG